MERGRKARAAARGESELTNETRIQQKKRLGFGRKRDSDSAKKETRIRPKKRLGFGQKIDPDSAIKETRILRCRR